MYNMPQLEKHRINLHLLTPLHVGTGQDVDPFSYVIEDGRLHFIDLIKWIDAFQDKNKLNKMVESDNFAAVRTFIVKHVSAKDFSIASISIDCPKLLGMYKRAIDNQDPRNQVLISPMMRNEVNMDAYIPGSSIKGAIRTAIANRFVDVARVTSSDVRRSRGNPDYNEKIFGRINNDPMKWLKIPDVSFGSDATVIIEAKEHSLNPDKSLTPKGFYEVAKGLSQTRSSVIKSLSLSLAPFEMHRQKIDAAFIIESLYKFYVPKYQEEYRKFYGTENIQEMLEPVNQEINSMKTNEALIRIGHFSHVECVTLDKVRKPRTRRGRDSRPLPWGTTRTLANGLHPFGWVKIEFCDIKAETRIPPQSKSKGQNAVTDTTMSRRRKIISSSGAKPTVADIARLKEKFKTGKI
ncbi:MAG: type III-A CRISPR-associated RAMP protein Csm5 [Syntrophobacterales bacterium]|nr:type III-A CRISPR-associated RAMP protein Csm5 [Syntrophobacterales bacterium]